MAVLVSAAMIAFLTLTPGARATAAGDAALWERVSCVTCPRTWLADIASNIVLFLPLGATLVLAGVSLRRTVLIGAAASLLIELLQLAGLPPGRAPALADLCSNTLGTWLGAWCAGQRRTLRAPSSRAATVMRIAWAAACAAMLVGTSLALAPATQVEAVAEVRPSPLPFTPGYGWYAAESRDASVGDVPVVHRGNGPVLVAARRTARVTASVTVRGRDSRRNVVPIVFVHEPAMQTTDPEATRAHLLLAQHGDAAWISSDLRAGRVGLCTPFLSAGGAFRGDGSGEVTLEGAVTPAAFELTWFDASTTIAPQTSTLRLSPALGWTLLQTVASASGPVAPLLTMLWLAAWFAPLGFWGVARRVAAAGYGSAMLWSLALVLLGSAVTWYTRTAPLSATASLWCVLASALGHLARRASDRLPIV